MGKVENGKVIYFPKVKEAREYLLEQAKARLELQDKLIAEAAAAGEYDAALRANQWVIEHTPANEEGQRVIDPSASKPKELSEGSKGPIVQIGIAFGGISSPEPKKIEGEVIDISTLKVEGDKTH